MDDWVKVTDHTQTRATPPAAWPRITARGNFLWAGDEKFWVRGVTYGTFRPDAQGSQFPARDSVERDFAQMAENGVNAVRTYTVPPRWLLDVAAAHGLRVMVGLPWEQHITFLDDRKRVHDIVKRVQAGVAECANHPALLCFAVGNEIPAPIVRWYGRRRIEYFIRRLYDVAKDVDPAALVTYVNYPTTEYLELPFLDVYCFNVYLEQRKELEAYLARLQNLADERPLLLAEIGLDSRRNGEAAQADSLDWQIRTVFSEGAVGTFVFAWTDEWYRGGADIDDWDFGLVTRDRRPKAALATVRQVFAEIPFPRDTEWPRVSVVVCSYNGARTIRDTLEGLEAVDYPDYEVIVVNDGSTDTTADIAREYNVKLISTENRGLSNARNTGWQAATGEIVAYIDDDAYPDPHWLKYLAWTFLHHDFVGVGGPNIAPAGDGPIAECVYHAPGGPVHVLLTDRVAEHIPGCNMAFRREALAAIDGFDARYRAAGDDVDLCWRLQDAGGTIGFHAAAMDWHHRRNSVTMFWRQQKGYGKAEALLEGKWPERYNPLGHLTWGGRLYGRGWTAPALPARWHVYHGTWGHAPFQPLYHAGSSTWLLLPLMPEWYLVIGLLAVLSLVGLTWTPLLVVSLPLLLVAIALPVMQAVRSAAKATFQAKPTGFAGVRLKTIIAFLHLMQPLARLIGRIKHGLVPWRQRGGTRRTLCLFGASPTLWFERWQDPASLLSRIADDLGHAGIPCHTGGDYDRWDIEIRGGALGGARLNMTVEEHGGGKQLFRFRIRARLARWGLWLAGLFGAIAILATLDAAWAAAATTATVAVGLVGLAVRDGGVATRDAESAVSALEHA